MKLRYDTFPSHLWLEIDYEKLYFYCFVTYFCNLLCGFSGIVYTNLPLSNSLFLYLNNLYARWKKPEKAIEYRDKFLGVKQSFLKQLE